MVQLSLFCLYCLDKMSANSNQINCLPLNLCGVNSVKKEGIAACIYLLITICSTVPKVLLYFIEMILEIFYFSSDEGAREIIFREVIEMK